MKGNKEGLKTESFIQASPNSTKGTQFELAKHRYKVPTWVINGLNNNNFKVKCSENESNQVKYELSKVTLKHLNTGKNAEDVRTSVSEYIMGNEMVKMTNEGVQFNLELMDLLRFENAVTTLVLSKPEMVFDKKKFVEIEITGLKVNSLILGQEKLKETRVSKLIKIFEEIKNDEHSKKERDYTKKLKEILENYMSMLKINILQEKKIKIEQTADRVKR